MSVEVPFFKKMYKKKRWIENYNKLYELQVPVELKNKGYQVVITFKDKKIDFWPSSGTWSIQGNTKAEVCHSEEELFALLEEEK